MDPLIVLVGATLLAVLLASAGASKLQDFPRFRSVVRQYQLVPAALIPAFSVAIPLAELLAAVLLIVDPVRAAGAVLAMGLLTLYATAIAINLLRGRRDFDCGCSWGATRRSEAGSLSGFLLARNAVLVGLAGLLAVAAPTRETLWIDQFNGVAGGVLIALLCLVAGRLVTNHRSMLLRRSS